MSIDDERAVESGCAGCRKQQSDLAGDQSLSRCSRCHRVSYCSKACQTAHWNTHKHDCKRPNYVIEAWVCKSQVVNPPVRRVLSCPATASFETLHRALQIAFGWANTHGWDFAVKDPDYDPGDGEAELQRMMRKMYRMGFMETGDSNDPREYLLRIRAQDDPMEQMLKVDSALGHARRQHPRTPEKTSTKIKLYEVFDKPDYRNCEWAYTYDFGDNWEHDIKLIDRTRPTSHFSCVGGEGTGIAEGAGGARGWEELKEAYRADNPTEEQKKKMYWYETHASNANRDGLRGGRADRWSKAQVNRLLAEAGL